MVISHLLPRKVMRNRTRQQSMAERHDYNQKAEKTNDGNNDATITLLDNITTSNYIFKFNNPSLNRLKHCIYGCWRFLLGLFCSLDYAPNPRNGIRDIV